MKDSFQPWQEEIILQQYAAYWVGINGNVLTTCDHLRVGVIQYFIRHYISVPTSNSAIPPMQLRNTEACFPSSMELALKKTLALAM